MMPGDLDDAENIVYVPGHGWLPAAQWAALIYQLRDSRQDGDYSTE